MACMIEMASATVRVIDPPLEAFANACWNIRFPSVLMSRAFPQDVKIDIRYILLRICEYSAQFGSAISATVMLLLRRSLSSSARHCSGVMLWKCISSEKRLARPGLTPRSLFISPSYPARIITSLFMNLSFVMISTISSIASCANCPWLRRYASSMNSTLPSAFSKSFLVLGPVCPTY